MIWRFVIIRSGWMAWPALVPGLWLGNVDSELSGHVLK